MNDERRLAARFAAVSGHLLSGTNEDVTFDAIIARAVDVVPTCDLASITLRGRRDRVTTIASTDPLADQIDQVQYAVGEGPCLDAAFESGRVRVDDVAHERRWPRWAVRAADLGVGSVLAIRLHTERETLGALNLYSTKPGGFDDENVDLAIIFASHATDAMKNARLVSGLQAALESRHTIGMAQGVLAMRYDISYERAFEVLRRYSNDTTPKFRDVAARVIAERDLPGGYVDPTGTGAGAGR